MYQDLLEDVIKILNKTLCFNQIILFFGFYFILIKIYSIIRFFYKLLLENTYLNYGKRYGLGSYVLITGSSDGIGKQFAIEFANKGFNLILVARNQQKLNDVAKEIQQKNEKVQIKTIVIDFSDSNLDNYEQLNKQIQGLDISILVNNVGVAENGNFNEISLSKLKQLVNTNVMAQTLMTRLLIPHFLQRSELKKRSLLIDVSSSSAIKPLPYIQLYASTKNFNRFFNESLRVEYNNKAIDFFCLQPGYVETNMTKKNISRKNWHWIDPKQCVDSCLRLIPNNQTSAANFRHQIICTALYYIPYTFLRKMLNRSEQNKIKDKNY